MFAKDAGINGFLEKQLLMSQKFVLNAKAPIGIRREKIINLNQKVTKMDVKKIKVVEWDLADLISEVKSGRLRIPRFQRDFVWEKSKVIKLLGSMYKEFPIGSFFVWEAPKNYNSFFRKIPELEIKDPDHSDEIKYILDGQQRITSLFVTIKGLTIDGNNYGEICFDLDNEKFVNKEGDGIRFIPLYEILGEGRHRIYNQLTEERKEIFDKCVQKFTKYPLSVVLIRDKNLEEVCEIFERINQGGKRLSIFDLVVAGTWSEDFELKDKIKGLNKEFINSFGAIDDEVITETLSLIIKKQCTRAYQLQLNSEDIKANWEKAIESVRKTIDFMKNNLGVKRYEFLPYRDLIPVIAYFYFKLGKMSPMQKSKIEEWFWKVSFSERYSTTTFTRMGEDRALFDKIIQGLDVKIDYPININMGKIKAVSMGRKSAIRNSILCILATKNPRNFRDNSNIPLDKDYFSEFSSSEKHHIFPKSYLRKQKIKEENTIVNFCFIPSELNKEISDKKPSNYFDRYKKENKEFFETLKTHLIPVNNESGIWTDEYHKFLDQRAELIEREVKKLVGITTKIESELENNPNKVVDELENKIRWKIHSVLYEEIGEDYWKEKIPLDVQDLVNKRIKEKLQKQPYEKKEDYEQAMNKIEFCDIMDYPKIILRNWNLFEDIFGSKEQLDKHFKSLKEYRNSIKHARKINDIERKEGEIALQWLLQSLAKQDELGDNSIQEVINDTEERHLIRPTGDIKEVYDKLKANIQIFGNDIEISPQKHYIAFKRKGHSNRNFLSLKLHKNQIKLYLPIEKEKINDPKKLARDVSSIGHHGTGRYEIIINSTKDLDYITGLIKQSYSESSSIIASEIDRNFHLNKIKKQNIHSRAEGLIKRILELSDDIQEHYSQSHIKFRRSVDFCLIYCQKNQFWVDVKLNRKEIKSQGLDIREHKDEKWTHIRVHEDTDLDEILRLIKIAEGKE